MSESLSRKEPIITTRKAWLARAAAELSDAGIDSARLDSELLLTHALNISRTALHAHDDEPLDDSIVPILEAMLSLRVIRVPLAYIVGHREFYGRLFKVTPSVLIPRPETEDIVALMETLPPPRTIVDVGTGSGALAISLALRYPDAHVYGVDVSKRALSVAQTNANAYETPVTFMLSDLLTNLPRFDEVPTTIVANLPYVGQSDERSPETNYEPEGALFAEQDGLELIYRLIDQAGARLQSDDYLLLESNPAQQPAIGAYTTENGFALERTHHLITVLRRI
jgi:release factor glutamine methyltransferase